MRLAGKDKTMDDAQTVDGDTLCPGVSVQLRSGGVTMTVETVWFDIDSGWQAYCVYWSDVRGKIEGEKFRSPVLRVVEEPK